VTWSGRKVLSRPHNNQECSVVKFIAINQYDDEAGRAVTTEQGQENGAAIGAALSEVSAKTGLEIDEPFVTIGAACIKRQKQRAKGITDAARARKFTLATPLREKTTQNKGYC
jgi:hypothetical protein